MAGRRRHKNSSSENNLDFVPIPSSDEATLPELVGQHTKDIARQEKLLSWTFGFIVAVLVVCVIAFVTFLIDAWRFHSETINNYYQNVQDLENKNRILQEQLINERIRNVQKSIDLLNNNQSQE